MIPKILSRINEDDESFDGCHPRGISVARSAQLRGNGQRCWEKTDEPGVDEDLVGCRDLYRQYGREEDVNGTWFPGDQLEKDPH